MPGTLGEITGISIAASGLTVAGLIHGQAGTNITQDTLTSISWKVTRYLADGVTPDTTTGSGSLVVADVVFDVPVTDDPRYTKTGGYNFLTTIPATAFLVGGFRHKIAIGFVPVTGEPFYQTWSTVPIEVP